MKNRLLVLAILSITSWCVLRAGDECYKCHQTLGDKPSAGYAHDIHFTKGISCAGCHGGNAATDDMERAMDTSAGFIGVPKGDKISKTCAGCHASAETMKKYGSSLPVNQLAMLSASVHGRLAVSGSERVAQCITCHGVHGIVSVKNPASPVYPLKVVQTCARCHADPAYMRSYNPALPVDQAEKYRTSVHGVKNAHGDPKPAACASCHGSHDIRPAKDVKSSVYPVNLPLTCSRCHSNAEYMKGYGIPTDQFEKFSKSVHGLALLKKHDTGAPACNSCHGNHGATPPGIASVSMVCGTCHALNADLFSASPHKKAFDERKLPECETCHGNHEIIAATNRLLGIAPEAVCSRCHHEQENRKGYLVAQTMKALVDSLDRAEREATSLIDEAEQKGMEVSEAKFRLRDAHQARLQSRTAIHSFNEAKFREVITPGMTAASFVNAEGRQAIGEYHFRRWGLGIATLIISVVGVSLYVLIRRIERTQKTTAHH